MSDTKDARPQQERVGRQGGREVTAGQRTAIGLPLPQPDLSEEFLRGFGAGFCAGYDLGWPDGRRAGLDEYDQVLVDGLVRMLGGAGAGTYGDAVSAHEKSLRAKQLRDRARREAEERAVQGENLTGEAA